MKNSSIRYGSFILALGLAACGDGWETQLTNTHFPYGNMRTAGSGVAYVRAQMLPEKAMNLTPVQRTRAPEVQKIIKPTPETVKDMEPVFRDKMMK